LADTDYRLYIDEVGTDDLLHVAEENHRFLSLTGVAMQHSLVNSFATPAMNKLKRHCFRFDPDEHLILHRSEILQKKGLFGQLADEKLCNDFDNYLIEYMTKSQFTVITAVIDKLGMMKQRHWTNQHPYHFLMSVIVEKFAQFLERKQSFGDVMPEKRHGKKDTALQDAFSETMEKGTNFVSAQRMNSRIRSRKLKFRDKKDNVTGLQICDLIAHPSHIYVRSIQNHQVNIGPFATRIITLLKDIKYDRSGYGTIQGYGIKYLP
jgi:hypothetical protein